PQIQNLIPMQYFNTGPTAAPIMGITAALIMGVGGYLYLRWREKKLTANGERYTEQDDKNNVKNDQETPNVILSILPLVTVLVTLNFFKWDIVLALISGILLILILNIPQYKKFIKSMNG